MDPSFLMESGGAMDVLGVWAHFSQHWWALGESRGSHGHLRTFPIPLRPTGALEAEHPTTVPACQGAL